MLSTFATTFGRAPPPGHTQGALATLGEPEPGVPIGARVDAFKGGSMLGLFFVAPGTAVVGAVVGALVAGRPLAGAGYGALVGALGTGAYFATHDIL